MSGELIGHVEAFEQSVTVERPDGTIAPLAVDDPIFQDDTIVTGPLGAVQIVFIDGTTFALGDNARITIDRLVYDPDGSDNGIAATLVQGSFVFLTGAIAPAAGDGITIDTPVGTMGIRGTFGGSGQQNPWDSWTIVLFPEVDGSAGKVVFKNGAGETLLEAPFDALELAGFGDITEPTTLSIDEALNIFAAALNVSPDDLLKLPIPQIPYDETNDYDDLNSGSGGFGRFGDLFHGGGLDVSLDPTALKFLALLRLLERGSLENAKNTPPNPPHFDGGEEELPSPPVEQAPVVFGLSGPSAISEGGTATYTVQYTGTTLAPGQTASVTVATGNLAGGTTDASPSADYTALSTILTFTGGGATSKTVAVSTVDDTILEGTEDFLVTIGGAVAGTVSTGQANTVIVDDDASNLAWNIAGSSSVAEGNTGTYTVSYTGVTVAPGQTMTVTVGAGDLGGGASDAESGTDYTALSTVLTFTGGGATSKTVSVSTIDDTVVEGTEDYAVTLSGPSVGNLSTSQAETVIVDDDASNLAWNIAGSTSITEGDAGTYSVSYTGATLAPGQTATVTVATGDLGGGTTDATAGIDYTALSTILTFTGGGATSQTVAVSTIEDTIVEGSEDFAVTLLNPSIGNLSVSQANAIVLDDDSVVFGITGPSVFTEDDANAIYSVSYTGATLAPGQTAMVTVSTMGVVGGSDDATAGSDYMALSTVLTFSGGGATVKTVAVSVVEDTLLENSEDFAVVLTGPVNGSIGTSQAGTNILDDEALNFFVSGSTAVTEGGSGAYTVGYVGGILTVGQTAIVTVGTGSVAGGDPDASSDSDYTSLSTVLTFTAGTGTSLTVAVTTIDDTVLEGTEDFAVSLSGSTLGTLGVSQAETAIVDNDASNLAWNITGSSSVAEGGTGTYSVSYTGVTLASGQTATVTVGAGGGFNSFPNATSGADYTALTTTLTFTGGGATSQTVAVSTVEDTILEGTEDYTVTLAGQSVGNLSTSQANTVIVDNDASNLAWNIAGSSSVAEGNTGTYSVSYTGATLAPGQTATIAVGSSSGFDTALPDAQAGSDYTALSTVLTFTGGGATLKTVAVSTIEDTIVEGSEDFTVTIATPTAGTVSTSRANTVIADNDAVVFGIAGATLVAEPDAFAVYSVSYTGATLAPGQIATVSVSTASLAGGVTDATANSDYQALSTILTFVGGGATLLTVSVSIIDDTLVEGSEDFSVVLSSPANGTLGTSQANTIIDDDETGRFLSGGTGQSNDTLIGGPGPDTIVGLGGMDSLIGNGGNDSILGSQEDDIALGGSGSDTIYGGSGFDTLYGGTGDDYINGDQSDDSLVGDDGNDTLTGGGGSGLDTLRGGAGNDWLDGGAGADTLYGDSGNDTLIGGNNPDSILGGTGNDSILGDQSGDTILAGNGNDWIDGGAGSDRILGQAGNDTIVLDTQDSLVDGGTGIDRLLLAGSSLNFDNITDAQLTGIEILDLDSGGTGRSVTLDAQDVLDFEATTGLTVDHDNNGGTVLRMVDLVIQGDNADSVTLDGGGANPDWSAGITGVSFAGYDGSYNIFYTSTAVVAIETDIMVAISN